MRTAHRLVVLAVFAASCGTKEREGDGDLAPALAATETAATPVSPAPPRPTPTTDAEIDAALESNGPIVDLAGAYRAPPPLAATDTPLYPRAMLAPVHAKPDPESKKIGWLRAGNVVAASKEPAGAAGCPGGWRSVRPAGYVCVGDKATLDAEDPIVKALRAGPHPGPDLKDRLPYMYGIATRGGPVYARIPKPADLDRFEPNLSKHIEKWRKDDVSGASYGLDVWFKWQKPPTYSAWDAWTEKRTDASIPHFLKDGSSTPNLSGLVKDGAVKIGQIDRRQGAAFVDSFLWEGRRYNVSTDLRLIPADRLRPIRGSDHHGVRIGVDVDFPFALIRRKGAKKWTYSDAKKKMIEAGSVEYRSAIELTGKQKIVGGKLHYETKDGFWLDDRHASRLDPAKRMPKWGKNGEKWMDVNITKQTLVAFEGEKAVYATLVSTGEDGLKEGARATKKGIFRVHTKYISTTMDSDTVGEEFELRDVPYVQYFEEGYALHGAYWHDAFGQPKSHGCINLAPEDARRLFHWTEPSVPPGWHGAAKALTGTILFIHP